MPKLHEPTDLPKLEERKKLELKLTGSPHFVWFEDEDCDIKIATEGVYVTYELTEYFYPVANIVECKIVTTLYDDEGHQCYNREGFYDA